jgi:hypothetical protein
MNSIHLINQWLAWQIGNRKHVMIGKDPLSDSLIHNLNKNVIYFLAQALVPNIAYNSEHWINSNLRSVIGMRKFYYKFKKKSNYT